MIKYTLTDDIKNYCDFVSYQGHAKTNAYTHAEFELFKQKYNRVPELVEIWDFDDDIKQNARIIVDSYYKSRYTA